MKKGAKIGLMIVLGSACLGSGIGVGLLIQENYHLKKEMSQKVEVKENVEVKQIASKDSGKQDKTNNAEEKVEVKEEMDPNAAYKQLAIDLEATYQKDKSQREVENTAYFKEYNEELKVNYLSDPYSYLLSTSDTTKIAYYDVSSWEKELLALARNEIYARHGYSFQKEDYKQIFGTKAWYEGLYSLNQITLSEVEKYNVAYLDWMEKVQKDGKVLETGHRGFSDAYCFTAGQSFKMDLNNDGIKEEIMMEYEAKEEDYLSVCRVKVNGEVQVESKGNWADQLWIVDIDETDDYKELVIYDYGPSSDSVDSYYYYNGEELVFMGAVTGHINDEWNNVRNYIENGILHAVIRNDILGTAWYNWDYKLNSDHILKEVPSDFFEVNIPIMATEDINVYASSNLSSKKVNYKAGTAFKAIGTDINEWIEVELEDGQKGWINEREYPSYQFEGLSFAD